MLLPSGGMRYSTLYSLSQLSKNAVAIGLLNFSYLLQDSSICNYLFLQIKKDVSLKNEREVAGSTNFCGILLKVTGQ